GEMVSLWDAARDLDMTVLRERIRWEGSGCVRYLQPEPFWEPVLPEHTPHLPAATLKAFREPVIFSEEASPGWMERLGCPRWNLVRPALAYLTKVVNGKVKDLLSWRLVFGHDQERPTLTTFPVSLLGALWAQFAVSIDGDKKYRQCPV